jgi:mannose-6-phosphate isomerase-like protein (cupin superfamily)
VVRQHLSTGGDPRPNPETVSRGSHIVQSEGLFNDGRTERRLGRGDTVIFPAGEVHQVQALTRMVLYRVQAGADWHPESLKAWPAAARNI